MFWLNNNKMDQHNTIKINELISLCIHLFKKSSIVFDKVINKQHTPSIHYKHENTDRFSDCDWIIQKMFELYFAKYFPKLRLIGEEDTSLDICKKHEIFNVEEVNLNLIPETEIPEEHRTVSIDDLFALLDPIDATERFLKEDYLPVTSLIAFCLKGKPFLGFIYYPSENNKDKVTYFNIPGKGLFEYRDNKFGKSTVLIRKDDEYVFLLSKRKPMESAIKIFNNFPGYTIVNNHGVGHKSLIGIINDYLYLFPSKGSAIWDICAGHCIAKEYGGGYYTTKGEEYPYDPENPYLADVCYFTSNPRKAKRFSEVFNTCGVDFHS